MVLGQQITTLDHSLAELIKLWERYFAGDLRVPPQQQRTVLERRLRQLHDRPGVMRSTDRFRLEQLQHRFMTYAQNWERMLREQEEGRGRSIAVIRATARAGGASAVAFSQPNGGSAAFVDSGGGESLFDRYREAKAGLGQKMGLDRRAFEDKIAAQRKGIEERLGRKVRFDVVVAEGRVKLQVRKPSGEKNQE